MTDLGPLDREGSLYSVTSVAGAGGVVTPTRTYEGQLYFTQVTPSVRTVLSAARDADRLENVVKCRWFDGLREGMILAVDGHEYRIVRHDEIGRREGWMIYGRTVE